MIYSKVNACQKLRYFLCGKKRPSKLAKYAKLVELHREIEMLESKPSIMSRFSQKNE